MKRNEKTEVIVVIPIHTVTPSEQEKCAFAQCYKILGRHQIKVLCPAGLDITAYRKIVPKFDVTKVEPIWLSSVQKYNQLKKSRYFYSLFGNYNYLLTYELDAFVFKDELLYWCTKNFDYVGAPWFKGWHEANEERVIIGVGNSGFSLRKISKASEILNRIEKIKYLYQKCGCHSQTMNNKFRMLMRLLRPYFKISDVNLIPNIVEQQQQNEDLFWCMQVGNTFSDYKIAPAREAQHFSFEVNPSWLYKQTNNTVPFGCHAWEKYEPEFWKPFIIPSLLNESEII